VKSLSTGMTTIGVRPGVCTTKVEELTTDGADICGLDCIRFDAPSFVAFSSEGCVWR